MNDAINQLYSDSLNYLQGLRVPKNEEKSFSLNQDAAMAGHADAILAMGWYYLNGVGVGIDIEKACTWYKKSARFKEPRAMFSLGQIAYGQRDWSNARMWFQRASELGHHRSSYWLGKLYWRGNGVEQDQRMARTLWQHAAEKKIKEAQRTIRMLLR